MVNIQKKEANYTIKGLRRKVSSLFNNFGVDEGARVSAIFVEAWLNNIAPLMKAKWDVYVDEHQDWHIHVILRTHHVGAYRGAVTVKKSDDLIGENYREMFKTIQMNHNVKVLNLDKIGKYEEEKEELQTVRIISPVEIRGDVYKVEHGAKGLSNSELDILTGSSAATPSDMEQARKQEALDSASVLELLGQGNFRVRG